MRATKPTEDSIEWDAAYTAEQVVYHLCLLEDHLLALARNPSEHCISCIYWHSVKLIGYSVLEAPKFFNAKDQTVFKAVTDLAVTVRDRREEMTPAEALEYKDQVRELRYQVAGMKAYEFGGEAVLADLSGAARLLLGGAEMGRKSICPFDEATFEAQYGLLDAWLDAMRVYHKKRDAKSFVKGLNDICRMKYVGSLSEAAELLSEATHLSATPEYVEIYKNTIHAHYKDSDKFHPDSIRMLKTTKRIRTTVGYPLTSDYKGGKCSTTQQVISIIMPKTKYYLNRVKNYQSNGATIIRKEREEGIEPRLSDDKEFQGVLEALKPENIVEVTI